MIAWPLMAELVLGFGVRPARPVAGVARIGHRLGGIRPVQPGAWHFLPAVSHRQHGRQRGHHAEPGRGQRHGRQRHRARFARRQHLAWASARRWWSSSAPGPCSACSNAPAPVHAIGEPYLQMLALALLLDAYNASMASVMRAHLRTRDAMLNILAMHALHLLLCLPLMRGIRTDPGASACRASRWRWRSAAPSASPSTCAVALAPAPGSVGARLVDAARRNGSARCCTSGCPARPRTSPIGWRCWPRSRRSRAWAPRSWPRTPMPRR